LDTPQNGNPPGQQGVLTPTQDPQQNQTQGPRATQTESSGFDFGAAAGPMQGPVSYQPSNNSLVSERLNALLAKDSPYIQAAKTRALQQANRAGLLNSSMAAGAGVLSAINAAMPIAQQDASTFATAERDNNQTVNTFARDANQFGRDMSQLQFRGLLDRESEARNQNFRREERIAEQDYRTNEATVAFSRELERMGYQNRLATANVPIEFAARMASVMQAQVAEIMSDANLSPQAKENAITNLVGYANAQMEWAERFFGVTMSRFRTSDVYRPNTSSTNPNTSSTTTGSPPVAAPPPPPAPRLPRSLRPIQGMNIWANPTEWSP
jgi:hypothetical protein